MPEPLGREICAGIGWMAHWLVGRDRRLARRNLALVNQDWPKDKVNREAKVVFQEIGRNAYDFLRYPRLSPERRKSLVELEGREHLEAARRQGKGAILATAHWGSWEVLAAHLSSEGYSLKSLARPLREARLERMLSQHRSEMGSTTISSEGSLLPAVRHLKQNGMLGVLVDQRLKSGGVFVDFFGQRTRVADGPVRLAQRTEACIVPLGISRLKDHRHRIVVRPPIQVDASTPTVSITQHLMHELESLILTAPEQWIWIHPRWEEAS
ncbi:MAG: lysophospholipid acyltransferase family protein [Candidatus Eisenbacteria bacterium]|uniref:Lysophospholipid acyltransferase family protein n=1 Tax=Eiseniibacteriota bacterium TaxID=2212470 RepID=A0A7Y2H1R5_UNCEI|nr:lysophospholipid acyltransferase family protein [Candidatus Eisenbacteria bacterium]